MTKAKSWCRFKAENQLPKLIHGVTFKDGVEMINQSRTPPDHALTQLSAQLHCAYR
jgi:hypothetical protein